MNEFIAMNNERILAGFKPVQERYRYRAENKEGEAGSSRLVPDERRFLLAVDIYQFRFTLTQIYGMVGFSACKGTKVAKACRDKKLIEIIDVIKGKGTSKYPVLLESAYKTLELEEKKFQGKGCGYEHLIWQFLIAEHFKEQKAKIEDFVNGKSIDVAIRHEGRLIAIEVAITSVNEKVNIEKDINMALADSVIIGCKDKKVLDEVNQIISGIAEGMRQKVRVLILSKILGMRIEEAINEKT